MVFAKAVQMEVKASSLPVTMAMDSAHVRHDEVNSNCFKIIYSNIKDDHEDFQRGTKVYAVPLKSKIISNCSIIRACIQGRDLALILLNIDGGFNRVSAGRVVKTPKSEAAQAPMRKLMKK